MRTIYFDYNATTPLDADVRLAMLPFLEDAFGNPSSTHHQGLKARAHLDEARERLACVFRCKPSEVVFTSGGTESNNLAIIGTARKLRERGKHLITSSVEHPSVLRPLSYLAQSEGFELELLPVDSLGRVDPDELSRHIRPDTSLVSIMSANNEVGTCQPTPLIGEICRKAGVVFHTDAVQSFGKESFTEIRQFGADLVSLCPHKLHGPKGVGALYIRSPLQLEPILWGGGHENDRRAGTENLAAVIGLVAAAERFIQTPVFNQGDVKMLAERLSSAMHELDGAEVLGSQDNRLINTVSVLINGCDSTTLLAALDLEGICVSSGSACSAGALTGSHVVRAMGRNADQGFIRFSLGRENTTAELEFVLELLPQLVTRARHHGPYLNKSLKNS